MRFLRLVLYAGHATSALFGVYLAWFQLNPNQLDASGHIASAVTLGDRGLHGFVPNFFLGNIQNLFYPPLEDGLIALLGFFSSGDMLVAYRLYLTILVVAYVGVIVWFGTVFRAGMPRAIWLAGTLFLLHVDKPNLTFFQGLSFIDIFVTGLTSEVLATVFLLMLLRGLIQQQRAARIALPLALCLLSHLVIGPVALLCTLAYALIERRRTPFIAIGVALALSAFFLAPMVLSKRVMYTSTLFNEPASWLFGSLLVATVLLRRDSRFLPLAVTGLLLLLPTELAGLFQADPPGWLFPDYHYYRLQAPALLLAFAVLASVTTEVVATRRLRRLCGAGVVMTALFLAQAFSVNTYSLDESSDFEPQRTGSLVLPASESGRRILTVSAERSCDFFLDSAAVYQGGRDVLFAKGLYWESSASNVLLTSYLATTLSPTEMVLDYGYYRPGNCRQLGCALDHFIRDYAIGWLVVPSDYKTRYLRSRESHCLRRTLTEGTDRFRFERQSMFIHGNADYLLFAVHPLSPETFGNAVVELISPARLSPFDPGSDRALTEHVEAMKSACADGLPSQRVPVRAEDFARLHRLEFADDGEQVATFKKRGDGDYTITLPESGSHLFKMRLNYFPGWQLTDTRGTPQPLFDVPGGMLGVGSGELHLRYRRPISYLAAYLVSGLTALFFTSRYPIGMWSAFARRKRWLLLPTRPLG